MKLEGAERKIMHAIVHSPSKELAGYVPDSLIAPVVKMDIKDVRDWLETLEGKGLVERARGADGFSAYVTAKGNQALRSGEPIESQLGDVSPIPDSTSATLSGGTQPAKPAFKGLRSYDQDDADF